MADTILIKAGNKANMPTLVQREIAYVNDEEALYIGTPDGNVKVLGNDIAKLTKEKLTASKAAAQNALAADANLAAVVAAFNALVAAMKESGQMNSQEE